MPDIIIVEDNREIGTLLCDFLRKENYTVSLVDTGEKALWIFEQYGANLVVLDIGLPGVDGYSVCSKIRETSNAHIMIATARDDKESTLKGLQIGADDYIVKPFSPGEVMARIRAVLRRIPAAAEKEMLVIGELSIHLPSLSVTLSGHKLNLTRREVELLYTLAASPGRVFTRDNLLTIVWGYEFAGNYRAVDSHIKRLRAKLDAYPHDTFTIATVWGAGYKFERNLP